MLIVLSPAKTLDYETPAITRKHTQPEFLQQAQELNAVLRQYSSGQLGKLMHISHELAELNTQRNQAWKLPFDHGNARQALLAFKGDVYTGMSVENFTAGDLNHAQNHLRILSGLYGVLRPLDLMQPYRLEMGTKLNNAKGKNLYAYWSETLTQAINAAVKAQNDNILVNLASEEYFSALRQDLVQAEIITPIFRDFSRGQYRVLSFFAKKARGMMASWIIRQRIGSVSGLRDFSAAGYSFSGEFSEENKPVFIRKAKA